MHGFYVVANFYEKKGAPDSTRSKLGVKNDIFVVHMFYIRMHDKTNHVLHQILRLQKNSFFAPNFRVLSDALQGSQKRDLLLGEGVNKIIILLF